MTVVSPVVILFALLCLIHYPSIHPPTVFWRQSDVNARHGGYIIAPERLFFPPQFCYVQWMLGKHWPTWDSFSVVKWGRLYPSLTGHHPALVMKNLDRCIGKGDWEKKGEKINHFFFLKRREVVRRAFVSLTFMTKYSWKLVDWSVRRTRSNHHNLLGPGVAIDGTRVQNWWKKI